jgi:LysR family transcriptional regulator, glycine cleavage system transcriptional activator
MSRRLPPLNPVRAFEAAARNLSFSKAADELNVTPAAVSHQVKTLEDFLGVSLFRRVNRAVLLTDAGQACLPGVGEGLDRIASAFERLEAMESTGPLTVAVGPAFAAKWLVPHLEDFHGAYPEIDVRLLAKPEPIVFDPGHMDVAIRFGDGDYPGFRVDRLFPDSIVPLCSPALLEGANPLRQPDDLRHHTLLHFDFQRLGSKSPEWRMWLEAAGVEGVRATRGPHFDHADHSIQAALDGHGVVLGLRRLVRTDIAAGRLVVPFDLPLPIDLAFYLICPEESADRPKVSAFRSWIVDRIEAERQADADASP